MGVTLLKFCSNAACTSIFDDCPVFVRSYELQTFDSRLISIIFEYATVPWVRMSYFLVLEFLEVLDTWRRLRVFRRMTVVARDRKRSHK